MNQNKTFSQLIPKRISHWKKLNEFEESFINISIIDDKLCTENLSLK